MNDDKPYVQVYPGSYFGYVAELVDPTQVVTAGGRSARIYWAKWFSFSRSRAERKGLRKLAKYNRLVERERKCWKVAP